MNKYEWLPLGKPKIDSLRLILPLDAVELNDDYIDFDYTTINNNTGQVVDEGTKRRFYNPDLKNSLTYQISHIVKDKMYFPVVKIGFSSKVCKSLYFQGIDKTTSILAYKQLQEEGIVKCSIETFLNAQPVDVDICKDVIVHDLDKTIHIASELTRPTTQANLGKNVFRGSTNKGIEWGKRDKVGRGYKTKQFLKFYAKALELQYNSTDFFNEYIEPLQHLKSREFEFESYIIKSSAKNYDLPSNLLRVETTIKDKAHFRSYGLEVSTFKDLLSIESESLLNMLRRPIYIHMTSRRIIEPREGMSTTHKTYLTLLKVWAETYQTSLMESAIVLSRDIEPDNKTSRYRLKKTFVKLIEMDMANPETDSSSQLDLYDMLVSLELIPKSENE